MYMHDPAKHPPEDMVAESEKGSPTDTPVQKLLHVLHLPLLP